jgi:hypothetical protein
VRTNKPIVVLSDSSDLHMLINLVLVLDSLHLCHTSLGSSITTLPHSFRNDDLPNGTFVAEFLRGDLAIVALNTVGLGLADLLAATFGPSFSFDLVRFVAELLGVASGDILLGTGTSEDILLADLGTSPCT